MAHEWMHLARLANREDLTDLEPIDIPPHLEGCSLLKIVNARINGEPIDRVDAELQPWLGEDGIVPTVNGGLKCTNRCEGCSAPTMTYGDAETREITHVTVTGQVERKCLAQDLIRQAIADGFQKI